MHFEIGTDGKAAIGIEEVLESLNEAKVETLLIAEGFSTPGVVCLACGFIGIKYSADSAVPQNIAAVLRF